MLACTCDYSCALFFSLLLFFFFNDTSTAAIYTLSLHDALPISSGRRAGRGGPAPSRAQAPTPGNRDGAGRSEEHTSELQSLRQLVCRLLPEKKKKKKKNKTKK